MSALYPLRVVAPGFAGLNTQLNTAPGLQWASEATNCVIDSRGRIAARRGRSDLTTSPISGTPAVRAVFEQVSQDGTTAIISAANNKLYSGTTTLTERTGTAGSVTGVTADYWQFQNIANRVVGFQAGHDPIVRTTGNFSLLQQAIDDWQAATVYVVGDIVKDTSGNETLYFHCTAAGTSGGAEPAWSTTVGATTADNTATWTTRKFPNGNVCHSAFGRIWVTSSGDDSVVEFSDTLIPHKFRGGAAGTLDLKQVWGGDQVVSIGSLENLLVIFGKRHVLIYSGADDPSTMTLYDKVEGVGCVARDTVANTGNDLVFLSSSGVRLFSRAIQGGGKQPLGDLSFNVRDVFMDEVAADTAANTRAVFYEDGGFYAVFLTGDDVVWVFDARYPNSDGSAKVTRWSGIGAYSAVAASDRALYLGGSGVVSQYAGYLDGTSTYPFRYTSTWVDFAEADVSGRIGVASRNKIPKSWRVRALTNSMYTTTFLWAYDYQEQFGSVQAVLGGGSSGSEWGVAEWGVSEWSGGDSFADRRIHPQSHGQVMKIGMSLTIDGAPISFHEILIAAKLGRLAF